MNDEQGAPDDDPDVSDADLPSDDDEDAAPPPSDDSETPVDPATVEGA
jgi:hypothetical protein